MYSLKVHGLVTFMNCDVDNFSSLLIFVVSFFDVMVSKYYGPVCWNSRCKRIYDRSINQSINNQQSVSQSVNKSIVQSVSQSIDR